MSVRVVVDSSASLPEHVVRELDITVVDLHRMESTTSGLSSLELAAAYARQLERGGDDGVVVVHLSGQLSSTLSNAKAAAAVFEGAVRVVDTRCAGMVTGAAAMTAAVCAAQGKSLDECADAATAMLDRAATWLFLPKLDFMRKSGRLSAATSMVSAATLAIKPIMTFRDGRLELAAKTRTTQKALSKLDTFVYDFADGAPCFVAVQHAGVAEEAYELRGRLATHLGGDSDVIVTEFDPALAVHTGPGSLAIGVVRSIDPQSGARDLLIHKGF